MAEVVLVECPRCGHCATHKPLDPDRGRDWFAPRRLVCPHCALNREWQGDDIRCCWGETPARDDYFHEILWIRGPCKAHEIWAYNWRHLTLIEQYVAALHRQHVRDAVVGWASRSFVNRLPKWISSAKNRDAVLNTINRIRKNRQAGP